MVDLHVIKLPGPNTSAVHQKSAKTISYVWSKACHKTTCYDKDVTKLPLQEAIKMFHYALAI